MLPIHAADDLVALIRNVVASSGDHQLPQTHFFRNARMAADPNQIVHLTRRLMFACRKRGGGARTQAGAVGLAAKDDLQITARQQSLGPPDGSGTVKPTSIAIVHIAT